MHTPGSASKWSSSRHLQFSQQVASQFGIAGYASRPAGRQGPAGRQLRGKCPTGRESFREGAQEAEMRRTWRGRCAGQQRRRDGRSHSHHIRHVCLELMPDSPFPPSTRRSTDLAAWATCRPPRPSHGPNGSKFSLLQSRHSGSRRHEAGRQGKAHVAGMSRTSAAG